MIGECPDHEILVRLGTPALGNSTYDRYIEHVDDCPSCQALLQRFVDEGMDVSTPDDSSILNGCEEFPVVLGFTIERKLGAGATGVVYLAQQHESERRVALKLIPGGHAAGPRERRHWLREVKAASKVRHPHVVTLYNFGEAEPWFYLALEFIPGGSLKDRLKGPLLPRHAARLVELIALAVHQIHAEGLFHLDLKPSNILIEGNENTPWEKVVPKVTDFSIARIAGDARTSLGAGMPFGTPEYMAPEQAGSSSPSQIGPASDVYALGAVLYELLTGRPPIQRNSIAETLEAICKQEPVSPRRLNPAIPRDLETICLKCLQKAPRQRYATTAELADDLRRWLDGFPIRARPVSKLEHANRWCRRRPAFASLLAVLAVTVASSLVGLITLWRHSEAERSRAEDALARAIESDQATSDAVRDLVGVLATTVDAPQMLAAERFEKSSRAVRELTAKLRRHRGFAASNLVAICELERQLAVEFWHRGDHAEARARLMDSLDLLEGRRDGAVYQDVDEAYARALGELGLVAYKQKRFDEALVPIPSK